MESMENFDDALKMFTKCRDYEDSERVHAKIARISEKLGSVNSNQAKEQADANNQPRRVLHAGDNVPVNRVLSNVLQRCFASEYEERKNEETSFSLTQHPESEDIILPLFVMSPLLPGEKMALNIFEPRYRLMIRRVMEGNKKFGMATVNDEHQLSRTACEAEIVECEALPDGRYTLEIIGKRRFAPQDATELDGYRIAHVEYVCDDHVEKNTPQYEELISSAEKLQRLTNNWLERLRRLADSGNAASNFLQDISDNPGFEDMEKFSFWATSTLAPVMQGFGAGVKSHMLETRCTKDRLDLCISLLEQFRQMSPMVPGAGGLILRELCRKRFLARGIASSHVSKSISANEGEASKVVVVESPAKARKIQEYLGDQYTVLASYGHIRDLPPKAGSVLPEKNFEMIWKPLKNSDVHLKELEKAISHATSVLLATDPDREGEAISWHLVQELRQRGAIRPETRLSRISFTSVTKEALTQAMLSPREIDQQLVDAYLARRALDYLFGFNLSPILWRKLPGATSAGRVQSVALKLVCEREKEIEQFEAMTYWTVENTLQLPDGTFVKGDVASVNGEKAPSPGYDSDSVCNNIKELIQSSDFVVHEITHRNSSRKPLAPYTTSTLQQDATRKLGLSSTRVMQLAQQLYEGGLITYMRTDSPALGQDTIHDIRKMIETCHGQDYLPSSVRIYKARVKNAQEAHEAIRPTNFMLQPHALGIKGYDSKAIHLYSMILNRAVASQAQNAVIDSIKVQFKSRDNDIIIQSTGSYTSFDGYLKILNDLPTDVADENSEEDSTQYHCLRGLSEGEAVYISSTNSVEHLTKAPARFTEGSLVKKMEEIGVGRPSTYAPTLKLLQGRGYVRLVKKRLYAEPIGRILTAFLQMYLPKYVDYSFTSDMEAEFDSISQGEQEWTTILQSFWSDFKDDTSVLADLSGTAVIDTLNKELEYFLFRHSINVINGSQEGGHCCPLCKSPLSVKLSHKGGPFIGCSNYPSCTYTSSLPNPEEDYEPTSPDSIGEAFKSLSVAEKYGMRGPVRLLGTDPNSGKEVFVRQGPYGPYIQSGLEKDPAMKRVPLPKDSKPRTLSLKYALAMLALPKTLGEHPDTGLPVEVRNGKFGPFIVHNNQMRSVPKELNPLELSLVEGLNLLRLAATSNSKKAKKFSNAQDSESAAESNHREEGTNTKIQVNVPRARSAYQFFLKENLPKYQEMNRKEKMKRVGEKWHSIGQEERSIYNTLAEEDLVRVNIQKMGLLEPTLESWEILEPEKKRDLHRQLIAILKSDSKVKSLSDSVPKPKTPYTLFLQDTSKKMKENASQDTMPNGPFMTEVARRWRSLSDSDRQVYIDLAARQQEEYIKIKQSSVPTDQNETSL
eukprot:jgi/Picsp_1/5875/NSC_03232-R2_mpn domain containing